MCDSKEKDEFKRLIANLTCCEIKYKSGHVPGTCLNLCQNKPLKRNVHIMRRFVFLSLLKDPRSYRETQGNVATLWPNSSAALFQEHTKPFQYMVKCEKGIGYSTSCTVCSQNPELPNEVYCTPIGCDYHPEKQHLTVCPKFFDAEAWIADHGNTRPPDKPPFYNMYK